MDVDLAGLNAMIDGGGEPAAPEAPVTEAPAETVETGETGSTDNAETFPRAYVEELRQEAAKYRTKAKQFEAFEAYSDEDRQVWTHLAQTIMDDPKAGAQLLQDIAKGLTAEEQQELAEAVGAEEPQYMTMADYKRLQDEQDMNQRVAAIERDSTALGYKLGSTEYKHLLLVASNETQGNVQAAHQRIEAQKQAWIDNYLASKESDASGTPSVPSGAGSAPSGAVPITNFKDASAAMKDFLNAQ